jgi:glycosyltransferase involved in cell wall biosynthesis
MVNTKISCIIPTCDRIDLLKVTLESVLKQTILPEEILIINNGLKTINFGNLNNPDHEKNHIKIFNLPKYAGLAQALNFGSSIAKGKYLAFLEDDDLWETDYIKKLSDSITSDYDAYVARIDRLKDGEITPYKNAKGKINVDNFFTHNPGVNISNLCISKEALFRISGFDARIKVGVDKCVVIDLLLDNCKFKVLEHIQEIGRSHEGVRLSGSNKNMIESQLAFYQKYKKRMNFFQKIKLIRSILFYVLFKIKK